MNRLHGFPNNLSTYGLVSGIYGSALALGAFVGPSVAGVLMDYVGFPYSTYLVIGTSCLLVRTHVLSLFLCKLKVFMMFIIVEIGNLCDTVSFLKTGTAFFTRRAFGSDPEEEDKLRIDRQQP